MTSRLVFPYLSASSRAAIGGDEEYASISIPCALKPCEHRSTVGEALFVNRKRIGFGVGRVGILDVHPCNAHRFEGRHAPSGVEIRTVFDRQHLQPASH